MPERNDNYWRVPDNIHYQIEGRYLNARNTLIFFIPACGSRLFGLFSRAAPFDVGAPPRLCPSETDQHLGAAGKGWCKFW